MGDRCNLYKNQDGAHHLGVYVDVAAVYLTTAASVSSVIWTEPTSLRAHFGEHLHAEGERTNPST